MNSTSGEHSEVVTLLLRRRIDVNATVDLTAIYDINATTVLHMAARYGLKDITRLLLDHGADTTLTDAKGLTPADVALEEKRSLIAQMLCEHQMDSPWPLRGIEVEESKDVRPHIHGAQNQGAMFEVKEIARELQTRLEEVERRIVSTVSGTQISLANQESRLLDLENLISSQVKWARVHTHIQTFENHMGKILARKSGETVVWRSHDGQGVPASVIGIIPSDEPDQPDRPNFMWFGKPMEL